MRRLIRKLTPPSIRAAVNFYLNLTPREYYGGPFNGQLKRQLLFFDIMGAMPFNAIVETGTYRGSTTEFFLDKTSLPVYSVDCDVEYYHYASIRLRKHKNRHLSHGDSIEFIKNLVADASFPKKRVFFYLDAHWHKMVLWDELDLILKNFSESVIMIDDFEVLGDPGYGFDDYGDNERLTIDQFRQHNPGNLAAFYPSVPSSAETGKKRGCLVLTTKDAAHHKIGRLACIKPLTP